MGRKPSPGQIDPEIDTLEAAKAIGTAVKCQKCGQLSAPGSSYNNYCEDCHSELIWEAHRNPMKDVDVITTPE